jgi:hypothetical protein
MPERVRSSIGLAMLISLLALCAGGKAILYDTLDPDCFWHLRVADQLCHDGIGPLVDTISFASEKSAWTPYSWLAELGMKGLWDAGGYRAAILAQAVMGAMFVVLIAMCGVIVSRASDPTPDPEKRRASSNSLAIIISTAFAAFLSMPYLSFRPATLAIVLLALCFCVIQRDCSRNHQARTVWLIVPITAILANVHLFVFLVPLWLVAVLIGQRLNRQPCRRLTILLIATGLASIATPMLPGMLSTLVHYQFNDPMVASPLISEMQPFWNGPMGKVSAILVLGFVGCILFNRHKLQAVDWLLLLGSMALLFMHGRYAPLFAIVAAPLLARTFPRLSDRPLANPILAPALALLLIVGLVRLSATFPGPSVELGEWLNRHGPETPGFPAKAADFVETNIRRDTGHLLNEFTWGGYLGWRFGDRYQVLLDGRTQVFSPAFWRCTYLGTPEQIRDYLSAQAGDAALLPRAKSRFRETLLSLGWRIVYEDDQAQVLVPPTAVSSSRF